VPELLTVSEVAQLMKVTPQTVLQWIHTKRLKAYKAGGQWRIWPEDLLLFLKGSYQNRKTELRRLN